MALIRESLSKIPSRQKCIPSRRASKAVAAALRSEYSTRLFRGSYNSDPLDSVDLAFPLGRGPTLFIVQTSRFIREPSDRRVKLDRVYYDRRRLLIESRRGYRSLRGAENAREKISRREDAVGDEKPTARRNLARRQPPRGPYNGLKISSIPPTTTLPLLLLLLLQPLRSRTPYDDAAVSLSRVCASICRASFSFCRLLSLSLSGPRRRRRPVTA